MSVRRIGRLEAVKLLYQMDLCQSFADIEAVVKRHFAYLSSDISYEARAFAKDICLGVISDKDAIDETIEKSAMNWSLSRMSPVDRNVLRVAIYELISCDEIPTEVIINEAVEIGKTLGSEDSGKFINGILDAIAKNVR